MVCDLEREKVAMPDMSEKPPVPPPRGWPVKDLDPKAIKFFDDLNDCNEAWTVYAEARFGFPAKARLTGEELNKYLHLGGPPPTDYPTYEVTLLPEGWVAAHDQFQIGFLIARGHRFDLIKGKETGCWNTWNSL